MPDYLALTIGMGKQIFGTTQIPMPRVAGLCNGMKMEAPDEHKGGRSVHMWTLV
jgi:hypothetical protein